MILAEFNSQVKVKFKSAILVCKGRFGIHIHLLCDYSYDEITRSDLFLKMTNRKIWNGFDLQERYP